MAPQVIAAPLFGPFCAVQHMMAQNLSSIQTSHTEVGHGYGDAMSWIVLVNDNTLMVSNPPHAVMEYLRSSFTSVEAEGRDGNVHKLTYKGHPFKPSANAQNLVRIVDDFHRVGYKLCTTIRTPHTYSDQLVFERDAEAEVGNAPHVWSIMMNGTEVWSVGAPVDICQHFTSAISEDCTIKKEKCDGIVKKYTVKSKLGLWAQASSSLWALLAHKAIGLMKTIEVALDNGWRIVGSPAAGSTFCGVGSVDNLMFAHASSIEGAHPELPTTGPVVGIALTAMEDYPTTLKIINAGDVLHDELVAFLEGVWGGKVQKKSKHEKFTKLTWGGHASKLKTQKKQPSHHRTTHLMFDLIVHMRTLGYEFLAKVKTAEGWSNIAMFRHCPGLLTSDERVRYFGVSRHFVDAISIIRPLAGDEITAIPNAIQKAITRNWKPGLKGDPILPSPATGDTHTFTMRGCPWVGRETGIIKSMFSNIDVSSLHLQLDLLKEIVDTGAELCAELTCIGGGHLWVFKMPIAEPNPHTKALGGSVRPGARYTMSETAKPLGMFI